MDAYDYGIAAQNNQAAGGLASIAAQQLASKRQAGLRERIQEANKRSSAIQANLVNLINSILPPSAILGAVGESLVPKDSTLSGDLDDLLSTLGRIEQYVSRISIAIDGQ